MLKLIISNELILLLLISFMYSCGKVHKAPKADLPVEPESNWPGNNTITYVDDSNISLGENTSGLTYQPRSVEGVGYLWVVKNNPSNLYKLIFNTSTKLWNKSEVWNLKSPLNKAYDSEGVTKAEWDSPFVYIATEKEKKGKSKLSIIMYDTATSKLVMDWDLTNNRNNEDSVLQKVSSNGGWEGITWIPDTDLVASHFYDSGRNKIYDPDDYPNHGTGLFVAGLEANGALYIYALNHKDNSFKKIAYWENDFEDVMGLEYDRSTGYLWVHCDDNCDNSSMILEIESNPQSTNYGQFTVSAKFSRPSNLKNLNYEGIAIFPDEECIAQKKNIIWSDDDSIEGESLSNDYIPCGRFVQ